MDKESFLKYLQSFFYDGEQTPLYIIESAKEACVPSKVANWYKDNLDEWSLHFVYSGKGYLEYNGKKVKVESGDLFLIPPLIDAVYYPDAKEPFAYYWIKFRGWGVTNIIAQCGFDIDTLVLKIKRNRSIEQNFVSLVESYFHDNDDYQCRKLGYLYLIFAELIDYQKTFCELSLSEKQLYVKKAMFFIEYNYLHPIKMKDIAANLGIHTNYLSNIFTEEMGISPKQYLLELRIEKAKRFLLESDVSIGRVAHRVGYDDPLYFSRLFYKSVGMSPTEFRKNKKNGGD